MDGIANTAHGFQDFINKATELWEEHNFLRWKLTTGKTRSLSQNALFHMWVGEISEQLIKKGRKDWTPSKVKDNLKNTFLGCEHEVHINMQTGEKSGYWKLKETSKLERGDMTFFMQQVESWAFDAGLKLTIPCEGEYMDSIREQSK